MSFCSFIATNYEMPEVDKTKAKYITVKEAIELEIKPHELVSWRRWTLTPKYYFLKMKTT